MKKNTWFINDIPSEGMYAGIDVLVRPETLADIDIMNSQEYAIPESAEAVRFERTCDVGLYISWDVKYYPPFKEAAGSIYYKAYRKDDARAVAAAEGFEALKQKYLDEGWVYVTHFSVGAAKREKAC